MIKKNNFHFHVAVDYKLMGHNNDVDTSRGIRKAKLWVRVVIENADTWNLNFAIEYFCKTKTFMKLIFF